MKFCTCLTAAPLLATLLAGAARADAVTQDLIAWSSATEEVISRVPVTGPASEARIFAMAGIAAHNALHAIEPRAAAYPYPAGYAPDVAAPGASARAAVDAAEYSVLNGLGLGQSAYLDALYADRLSRIDDGEDVAGGVAVGASVAAKVLAMRAGDGIPGSASYTAPPFAPGVFQPDPGMKVSMPHMGVARTFAVQNGAQFVPAGPPALDSGAYLADLAEVKAIGGALSETRTLEQSVAALFWSEQPARTWNRIARSLAPRLDGAAAARMFALLNIALADVDVTCLAAKYRYVLWRPFEAIGWSDGLGWTPLVASANRPEYPAWPSAQAAVAQAVLGSIFGDATTFRAESTTAPGVKLHFDSFGEAAAEISEASIWAGDHFRTSTAAGTATGAQVAGWVLEQVLLP